MKKPRIIHPQSDNPTLPMSKEEIKKFSAVLHPRISNRYAIKRVLGRGAFGIVYLAEDRKIGRLVAIKKLFEGYAKDEEMLMRFRQEAKIAGRLEHQNIVIVYNVEGDREFSAIIMEYLGGGSLADLLRKSPNLDFKLAIRIMLGILTGLDAAHHMMVIHRDIKPQNILFGIGSTPKIADFGVAHLPKSAGGFSALDSQEEQASMIGTPLYMSPEQSKMEDLDSRSDLYSCGSILYEMLTGKTIFSLESELSISQLSELIINATPQSIENFRNDVPKQINDVIFRLLEKKPDFRYPDAVSVMRDLVKVLSLVDNETPSLEEVLTPSATITNSPGAILEDIIYLLLVDGMITRKERVELGKRAERLGLSEPQSRAIEKKLRQQMNLPKLEAIEEFTKLVESTLDNKRTLTPPQQIQLARKQEELGISEEEKEFLITELTC